MEEPRAREAVKALLDLVNARMVDLTSPWRREHAPRQMAAGGLARCVMLLEGMHALTAPDARPEVIGVLMRSFAEAWLVTNYVLLGG
ncbi:MAG TPA: hypothetical protein VGQ33_09435, partial [Vicinamibacteria bacterium]|nr:hypothetical protein [Vicinamibacteria bacterium]